MKAQIISWDICAPIRLSKLQEKNVVLPQKPWVLSSRFKKSLFIADILILKTSCTLKSLSGKMRHNIGKKIDKSMFEAGSTHILIDLKRYRSFWDYEEYTYLIFYFYLTTGCLDLVCVSLKSYPACISLMWYHLYYLRHTSKTHNIKKGENQLVSKFILSNNACLSIQHSYNHM